MVLEAGFGLADLENEVPARAETVYRLASISKAVAGVLADHDEQGGARLDVAGERRRHRHGPPDGAGRPRRDRDWLGMALKEMVPYLAKSYP